MTQFTFNAGDFVAPPSSQRVRGPLPKGNYAVIVLDSVIKATNKNDGQYIELTMQVIEGPYAGRRHWERLNVSNPSKQAEEIAKARLQSICQAVGVPSMTDTGQLHDKPFSVTLDIDRKDETRNRMVGAQSIGWADTAPQAAPAKAAAPAASSKKPWEK
jgi:Protein of unknown function (DUF669)